MPGARSSGDPATKEAARQGSIRPLSAAPFACLHDRERQGFQRHPHRELLDRGGNEFVQFFYFPYSQADAQVLDGRPTQQWLICATGGVDAQNGSRTSVSGPVVAYKNENTTYRLGHAWREGKTPADHTVTLGFQVGKGPVNVNGSIQQTPTEKLKGSPLALFNDNRYGRNQAAGWWEHGCRPVCRRWNGSADFQGSVVEALFEFPQGMPVRPTDFYYAASVEQAGCDGRAGRHRLPRPEQQLTTGTEGLVCACLVAKRRPASREGCGNPARARHRQCR